MDKGKEMTVTVSMVKLNIYSLLIIFALAFGIGYLHIFLSGGVQIEFTLPVMFLLIIGMIVFVCIHGGNTFNWISLYRRCSVE